MVASRLCTYHKYKQFDFKDIVVCITSEMARREQHLDDKISKGESTWLCTWSVYGLLPRKVLPSQTRSAFIERP